jgi:hypothetical protein
VTVPSCAGPRPGRDEITLAAAEGQVLCSVEGHRAAGGPAVAVVVLGDLGTGPGDGPWWQVAGTSLPVCGECWNLTRTVVTCRRPGLVIHGRRVAAPSTASRAAAR